MIENLNSENTWVWNCPLASGGGKNDLDYCVAWGTEPAHNITIRRHNLIGIKYSMKCWNRKDGWVEKSHEQMLPSPVEKHTFNAVALTYAFARQDANNYWGVRYKIESKLIIIYGEPPSEVEEIITTNTNGCFIKNDPYYFEFFSGCIPPDIPCEEQ